MTKLDFHVLLLASSNLALRCTQPMVTQSLASSFRYHVLLNQSADHLATKEERLFPEDTGKELAALSEEEVVSLLCRDERCPAWIDISVEAVDPTFTLLNLRCCGRFSDNPEKMHYAKYGRGPFGVKSPVIPVGWKEGMRFTLKNA